jgi:hypothetical protein
MFLWLDRSCDTIKSDDPIDCNHDLFADRWDPFGFVYVGF